jgi:MATE family multidrug resistance protein
MLRTDGTIMMARRIFIRNAADAAPVPGRRRRARLLAHETGALLRLAVPIAVGQLGAIAMHTTDTLMVGPLGPRALAAAGLGNALYMALLISVSGVLSGIAPLVSQSYGAGDEPEARRVAVQGLWLALLLALPVTALSVFGRQVSLALGQDAGVAAMGGGFMLALAPGVVPGLLFAVLKYYLDALGRPRVAMWVTFVGVAVNVIGNRIFIYGVPGVVRPLGVVGSGLSTTLVRWAMLGVIAVYVARHPELSPFRGARLRPDGERLRRIGRIGGPIGAQLGAEIGTFSVAAVMMGWMGPAQLAAHQVTLNLASATFMVAVGAAIAGSIRVGRAVGAGSRRGVHRAVLAAYGVTSAFMALTAASFLLFPRFLLELYTHNAEILRYGTGLLLMAGLFQLFDGAQVAGISLLRGAADTRVPMLITLLGYWGIGIPVAYWLGFHTELRHVGVWAGLTLSLAVVALLLLWRVRLVLWRRPVVAVVSRPVGLTQRRGDTERTAEPLRVSVALREADL